jgi:hypothetical protein
VGDFTPLAGADEVALALRGGNPMKRLRRLLTSTLLVALMAGGAAMTACKSESGAEVTAENIEAAEDVIAEEHDTGTMVWQVTPEGQVKVLVKDPAGKPVEKDVSGTLTFPGDKKVPMTFEKDEKLLVASGPKLEGDLVEVKYEITVEGKSWNGAIHLPAGGTKQLVDGAKKAAAKEIPAGKVGPNGGIIQVVGDDVVEVVADKASGEVRVYVLGPDFKPVAIGSRKVKLGLVGGSAETVVLAPGPGDLYFTGKLSSKVDPVKLTVVVTHPDHVDVVLVGHRPGARVVVGARAPSVKVLVVPSWKVDVKVRTPGVVVVGDDDDDDDGIRVNIRGHGHGRGGAVIRF